MADVRISARSTLGTLNKWVEVISGNLVGSQITGYKATRLTFGDSLVDLIRGGSGNAGALGGINPVQIGSGGISVGGTTIDFRQGSLLQTGNNNDLSIQGNAFFTIADSSGKIIYTRSGEFSFDDQGYLVNKDGAFVLGLYDSTRKIIQVSQASGFNTATSPFYTDLNGASFTAMSIAFNNVLTGADPKAGATTQTGYVFNNIFGSGSANTGTGTFDKYFKDNDVANRDRVIGRTFVPKGILSGTNINCVATSGMTIGIINGVTISVYIPDADNRVTRTSTDNARLIARAINSQSSNTGIGASVVVNLNDQNQATLVLGAVNRVISEVTARLPTKANDTFVAAPVGQNGDMFDIISAQEAGLVKTFKDNKGNIFYQLNSLTLAGSASDYRADPGDVFQFDSTGSIVNSSKGKDLGSAPPFNTGIHVAVSKFSNNQGLEKVRGGSIFRYTEATGTIQIGYAGMSKQSQISTKTAIEENGNSTIGAENQIISQALETSNASVTDALPELTVAQKTFTSNTKVVSVGNSIVDDLNGLIR